MNNKNIKYVESAARIKQLRKNAGYTQRELAKLMDLKPTTISSWERGISQPVMNKAERLANLLHTNVNYLLGIKPNEKDLRKVDLKEDPIVLSYGGKPVSKKQLDLIKGILDLKNED